MRKFTISTAITIILILISNCDYNPVALPETQDTNITFNTGEKKWVQLNPDWTGFNSPQDLVIAPDKYIYVSDKGNNRIVVLNKSGKMIQQDGFGNDFTALYELNKINAHQVKPMGIDIDSKLSLFITDSTNMIYCWNQYINYLRNTGNGQDSVAEYIVYRNQNTNQLDTISDFSKTVNYENQNFTIEDTKFQKLENDSIFAPHIFYKGSEQDNFVTVAAAPDSNFLYAANTNRQSIHRIRMVRSDYLKFGEITIWQYRGVSEGYIATNGTGAGTVNDPTGIEVDQNGAVYYTQTGENFGFHKIRRNSENNWASIFSLNEDEIMDLDRFKAPQDVTVDEEGNIFVLNSGKNEIQEFNFAGEFVRKAGLREVQIDTSLSDTIATENGTSVVEKDTIITRFYNDILAQPEGIEVDDGVLYITNTANNSIVRFKLSTDLDVNLEEE